ncbi:hypothetical protein EMIT0194MI4_20597 [Pseudomonas sp. IT-194MI4]
MRRCASAVESVDPAKATVADLSYRQVSRQLISGRSCLVLDRGRIVEQGEVWQIFGDPQHEVSPAVATDLLGIAQGTGWAGQLAAWRYRAYPEPRPGTSISGRSDEPGARRVAGPCFVAGRSGAGVSGTRVMSTYFDPPPICQT